MGYSINVTSNYVSERIEAYRMEMISAFSLRNIAVALRSAAEQSFGKRQATYDILANIYAENKGIQFIYYTDSSDTLSVGNGIGDIEKRSALTSEFNKIKNQLPNQLYWRYETVDNGEKCIVCCKDIILVESNYTKVLVGTVLVGLNVDDLNDGCFSNVKADNNKYLCNHFITDAYGKIAFATETQLIGTDAGSVLDESKELINNRKSVIRTAKGDDWSLISYIDTGIKGAEISRMIALIISIVILVMTCISFVVYFISRRTSRPLEQLYSYVQHIKLDDKYINVGHKTDNSEIGQIETAFNDVLKKLADENVKKCGSIKFLLQPFVENSIKYGFKSKKAIGKLPFWHSA